MRCSYWSRRRGLEPNPLHAHPLTHPHPHKPCWGLWGTPGGSLEHSLKITILIQPPPFTTGGKWSPEKLRDLAEVTQQVSSLGCYLPSTIFPWWHLSSRMNYLLFLQTVRVFVFVCLSQCPGFQRKPNKPVPAFTLKLGVRTLDTCLACPGQKGRGS